MLKKDSSAPIFNSHCPLPHEESETVQLAHGCGGRRMRQLIEDLIVPILGDAASSAPLHDSAVLKLDAARIAFTTDTFVVSPLFFPGGDIGKLALCGTVNDLAMAGAQPLYLSCGLILEEGIPLETVRRILVSLKKSAEEVGAQIVTGDTKVVDRGKADGIFINTSGVGVVYREFDVKPERVEVGDAVLVSGDLGRHGVAVMSVREGLAFEGTPPSDCAPLDKAVAALRPLGDGVHCLRDLTRGGLASALVEIADSAGIGVDLEDALIPVHPAVAGACELLGLDPLYVANEGRFVAFIAPPFAEQALSLLNEFTPDQNAAIIGYVVDDPRHSIQTTGPFGSSRLIEMLSGEQLPRIC